MNLASGALIQDVLNATKILYGGSGDPNRIKEADGFLRSLQGRPEVWSVCYQLIQTPDREIQTEAHWFAASTLHLMVYRHLDQLQNPADRAALKEHLLSSACIPSNPKVQSQLARTLGILVILMMEWEDPVSDLIQMVHSAYNAQNFSLMSYLVDAIGVAVEEFDFEKLNISREFFSNRDLYFTSQVHKTLVMVGQLLKQVYNLPQNLQVASLKTFRSWLLFSYRTIDPNFLENLGILPICSQAVQIEDLFDVGIDCLVGFIRATSEFEENIKLVETILTTIVPFFKSYESAIAEQDETREQGYARLFVELGENYIRFLLASISDPKWIQYEQVSLGIINQICRLSSHKSPTISFMSLHFWYSLSQQVDRLDSNILATIIAKIGPIANDLMSRVTINMKFPNDIDDNDEEEVDDLVNLRSEASMLILDISVFLSIERTLSSMLQVLEQGFAQNSWQEIESVFYVLKSLAPQIPREETNYVPRILSCLDRLPANALLMESVLSCIGKLSPWVDRHPEFISVLFSTVLSSLQSDQKFVCRAAASSFRSMAESSSAQLSRLDVLNLVHKIILERVLSFDSKFSLIQKEDVFEGTAALLSALPLEDFRREISRFLTPFISILKNLLSQFQSVSPSVVSKNISSALELLGGFLRSMNTPILENGFVNGHPLVGFSICFWEISKSMFSLFENYEPGMENLTRVWKHLIRDLSGHTPFDEVMSPLISHTMTTFLSSNQPSLLYFLSICVDETLCRQPHLHAPFSDLFYRVLDHTMPILNSESHFDNNPKLVEDFFTLCVRIVEKGRMIIVSSPRLAQILEFTMLGFRIQHREACDAVLRFCRKLFESCTIRPDGSRKEEHSHLLNALQSNHIFLKLMELLIHTFSGAGSRGLCRSMMPLFKAVLLFDFPLTLNCLQSILSQLPAHLDHIKEQFIGNLRVAQNDRAINQAVMDFERGCRLHGRY